MDFEQILSRTVQSMLWRSFFLLLFWWKEEEEFGGRRVGDVRASSSRTLSGGPVGCVWFPGPCFWGFLWCWVGWGEAASATPASGMPTPTEHIEINNDLKQSLKDDESERRRNVRRRNQRIRRKWDIKHIYNELIRWWKCATGWMMNVQ